MRHLIGRKWEDSNCAAIVALGLAHMGLSEASLAVPASQRSAERLVALEASGGGSWERQEKGSHQSSRGEVILSAGPQSEEFLLHVSLALGDGTALTSTKEHGACIVPIATISGPLGVYRYTTA